MEVVLIPHRRFPLGACRLERPGNVLDVVGISGDERDYPFRPQRRKDTAGATAPIVATDHRFGDRERIEQRQEIAGERGLLARARRIAGEKARRTVAAQVGNDDARACRGEARRDLDEGVHVVREAVAHDTWPAIARASIQIGHLETTGLDRFEVHYFGSRLWQLILIATFGPQLPPIRHLSAKNLSRFMDQMLTVL